MKQALITLCAVLALGTVLTAGRRPSAVETLARLEKQVRLNTARLDCLLATNPECEAMKELSSAPKRATHDDGMLHNPMEVGHMGRFYSATVSRVQDSLNMVVLAKIHAKGSAPTKSRRRYSTFAEISTVRRSMHGPKDPWHKKPVTIWLRGVPTRGLVDGAAVDVGRMFFLSGTKSVGSTTMFVAEPR